MQELINLEEVTAVQVFTGDKLDPLLEQITTEAKSIVPDLTTAKGRKAIASMAAKVARSKTYLDGLGKDLVADQKAAIKTVDAERKRCRDFLDNLKVEVRQPLTAWEDAEKARVGALQARLDVIKFLALYSDAETPDSIAMLPMTLDEMKINLTKLESVSVKDNWEEFAAQAAEAKEESLVRLKAKIAERKAYEEQQAELERLRIETAQREQKEREERIAREAREQAESEAKDQLIRQKLEKEFAEKRAIQAEHRRVREAEQAKQDAINAEELRKQQEIEAEQRRTEEADQAKRNAEEAEARRIKQAAEAEERRLHELAEADRKAKIQAEQAAQQERNRQEQERRQEEEARIQREANIEHKKAINNAAMHSLICVGLNEDQAKAVVVAIAKRQISNVTIQY